LDAGFRANCTRQSKARRREPAGSDREVSTYKVFAALTAMFRQTVITKKRRGPAPTGKGTLVGVRLQPAQLEALDAWIAKQKRLDKTTDKLFPEG
jgi:hypothetical protein